jgi:hypothetical protein
MSVTTPKPQQYPASLMKVGAVLYRVSANTDDSGKVTTEYQEWVVRSIKARRGSKSRMGYADFGRGSTEQQVNLTQKLNDLTWVKRAGKQGWATSIPDFMREQFEVGQELPCGMYTTQRAALVYAIRRHQDTLKKYDQWISEATGPEDAAEWRADKVAHEAELRALLTRFKKAWPAKPKST